MTARREGERILTDSPQEEEFGYARAVRAGEFVLVSGCTAVRDGVVQHEGDPYGQARVALERVGEALAGFGLGTAHVVRTRMYVTHARDADAVGRAHRDVLGEVRPAATLVVVNALADTRMMVEIEADAHGPAGAVPPAARPARAAQSDRAAQPDPAAHPDRAAHPAEQEGGGA